jgi:uncharacterized membrane protein YfcA
LEGKVMSWYLLLAVASSIVVIAAWSQGVSGFGFALISFPLLLLVSDTKTALVLSQTLAFASSVRIGWHDREQIKHRELWIMLFTSLPCVWLGSHLLLLMPVWAIQLAAGIVACLCAGLLALGVRHVFRREKAAVAVAGTLGGILQGCTGMGGPPVVLMLSNQGWAPQQFRSTLSVLFSVNATVTLVVVWSQAGIDMKTGASALLLLPVAILGTALGLRSASRISPERFRGLVLSLVFATGVFSVVSGATRALPT